MALINIDLKRLWLRLLAFYVIVNLKNNSVCIPYNCLERGGGKF